MDGLTLRSPQQALAAQDANLLLRCLHALNTVERYMDAQFRGESFEVGFADPPLGGGDGWLETEMVPHVQKVAEDAGWRVETQGSRMIFTARQGGPHG